MNGKEKSQLNEISFTIGAMHADIKTIKKNQDIIFEKVNVTENRSLTNEKDIKNIYKNAGIVGSVFGFLAGVVLWIIGKIWR